MLTNDELRKAVDAAPEWDHNNLDCFYPFYDGTEVFDMAVLKDNPQLIAALASALVELVDASEDKDPPVSFTSEEGCATIKLHYSCRCFYECNVEYIEHEGPNRNENTIRAVLAWLESKDAV